MLARLTTLNAIDPLPGLGAVVRPLSQPKADPITAFERGDHRVIDGPEEDDGNEGSDPDVHWKAVFNNLIGKRGIGYACGCVIRIKRELGVNPRQRIPDAQLKQATQMLLAFGDHHAA